MSSGGTSDYNHIWKELHKMFGEGFPFRQAWNEEFLGTDGEGPVGPSGADCESNMFETDQDVFITIRFRQPPVLDHVRIHASSTHVMMEGLPNMKERTWRLPAIVKPEAGKVTCRDTKLQIQLPIIPRDNNFKELHIRHTS